MAAIPLYYLTDIHAVSSHCSFFYLLPHCCPRCPHRFGCTPAFPPSYLLQTVLLLPAALLSLSASFLSPDRYGTGQAGRLFPGSRLLQVAPNCATLIATFLVYAITPPLLAQYSGNSAPVCPLAEPMLSIDLTFF